MREQQKSGSKMEFSKAYCYCSQESKWLKFDNLGRSDREILSSLARRGQAPVSADQGLTLSQQSGCVMYTETSSKVNPPSVFSTFEVAALAKVSHMSRIPRYI